MWPYWLMFFLPALVALASRRRNIRARTRFRSVALDAGWVFVVFIMTLVLGFRFKTGGDWNNYYRSLLAAADRNLVEHLQQGDPGYRLLEWLSIRFDWDIFGVNLIGGFIFAVGLAVFCRGLPRPWLALAVAVPYLFIVVGMGYTRQGIALGLAMLGLIALERQKVLWFVFCVALGATFHKSAVIMLPIAALAASRNRYLTIFWTAVVAAGAYVLFLEDEFHRLYRNYVEAGFQSQGALVRLLMNAIPAVVLLVWHRRFEFGGSSASLWRWFALISLALFGMFFLSPSSTAVDRIALYMLPLQLVVFSHLPDVFGRRRMAKSAWAILIIGYYATVQFVWLNFAANAFGWLPYRNYIFIYPFH